MAKRGRKRNNVTAPKIDLPKPAKPPSPTQIVRDVERNIKDGPIKATKRVVGRVQRETKKILP